METEKELKASEEWQSNFEANKDDARDAFIDEATQILMPIQHHVDEIDCCR